MIRRVNSREDILAAAEQVVLEHGAGHLTLDAVAERAGVSKGGLLYHFPGKEDLLRGMLQRLLDRADETRKRILEAGGVGGPGASAELRAYVQAGFDKEESCPAVSGSLLAAGANDPRLLGPVRDWHVRNFARFSEGSRHPLRVLALMLALDGLWLNELLGTACFGAELREQLRQELLRMATEAV